ncbi:bromo adjacent homology domain-containing 1 protein [Plakobranchus ocellatus]|uniref:Bromo adjacent homology domain-containing 1 protein n=1 Tax=Plakobranchus ocellatus TaxID=259542 RepID=A0AAV4B9N3_9GAST|nr:bromo adjacent homology domain-containing 1 protein [Plakobranchus ocellatus]
MKAKPVSRSGSPAVANSAKPTNKTAPKSPNKTEAKSPNRSALKSPNKTESKSPHKAESKSPAKAVSKEPTKASAVRASNKSPVKTPPKSPAKKSPTAGKNAPKQQKTTLRQSSSRTLGKGKSDTANAAVEGKLRERSPRPAAESPMTKSSPAAKEKMAPKNKETAKDRVTKSKPKTSNHKNSQDALRGCKKSALKKTPTKIATKIKKKKIERELSTSQFIDLWTLANIGKREASLNASMKVNIMYESVTKSPPKALSTAKPCNGSGETTKDEQEQGKSSPKKPAHESKDKGLTSEKCDKQTKRPMLSINKTTKSKNLATSASLKVRRLNSLSSSQAEQRKRKSPHYKIFKEEEEPLGKRRKIETKKPKSSVKSKKKNEKKSSKKKSKVAPSGHQLCNIIEKSPRQASLIAKAMIALEQEEDVVQQESVARAKVYEWQELRPYQQNHRRRIVWVNGLAKSAKDIKEDNKKDVKPTDPRKPEVNGKDCAPEDSPKSAFEPSEALHSSILRTLHELGDPRMLREFYRAQKEDYPGYVDVEKCDPPPSAPRKDPAPPPAVVSPMKEISISPAKTKPLITPASPPAKNASKLGVSDKSESCSPAKPQPCRVATPIPQFPLGQRTSHMTSFIHHPIPHQHLHPHQQQQQQQQQQTYHQQQSPQQAHTHHPQPIKVTPYSPGSAYIYQLVDRPQSGLFVPPPQPSPSPSPLPYGLAGGGASPAPHNNFQSSFTLSHMGTLSLNRRGVNPYDQAYNSSMQQFAGFNLSYYPAAMQGLQQPQQQGMQPLSNLPNLHSNMQNLGLPGLGSLPPLGMQQFPLVQPAPMVAHQQVPHAHDVTQYGSFRPNFSPFSHMPAGRDGAGFVRPATLMPPPAHSHKPAHTPMGPPAAPPPIPIVPARLGPSPHRQHQHQHQHPAHQQQQKRPCASPIESLRSMNPQGVQPIIQSGVLQFSDAPAVFKPSNNHHVLSHPIQPASLPPKLNTSKAATSSPHLKQPTSSCVNQFVHTPITSYKKELTRDNINPPSCDIIYKSPACNAELQTKPAINRRTSTEVSDVLHSVHNAMFETDSGSPADGGRDSHQAPATPFNSPDAAPNYANENHAKSSSSGPVGSLFNTAYSMSSILDLPSQKLKSEPQAGSCEYPPQMMQNSLNVVVNSPSNLHIAFPSNVTNRAGADQGALSTLAVVKKEHDKEEKPTVKKEEPRKPENNPKKRKGDVIVIEDSDVSSEDEPLAKLIQKETSQKLSPIPPAKRPVAKPKAAKSPAKLQVVVKKFNQKQNKGGAKPATLKVSPTKMKPKPKLSPVKRRTYTKKPKAVTLDASVSSIAKGGPTKLVLSPKKKKVGKAAAKSGSAKPKKPAAKNVKTEIQSVQNLPRVVHNHGWSWIGEGQVRPVPKLTIAREEQVRMRRCYQSMVHTSGERVTVGDCVLLQSDGDANIPYVAKVTCLWENLNGDKMFSMLWYYQPEHTVAGRSPDDGEQELFASKHREENSVACIDDKCYVLMYNEYCRLEAEAARSDLGAALPRWREEMPGVSPEDQHLRRQPPPSNACVDNIWFCRYDYNIRKKYVRKPKHKKSNLRY